MSSRKKREEAAAEATRQSLRPSCKDCGTRPQADLCGGRCLTCWGNAAQRWVWNGNVVNAFRHPKRN
jgi:hypothetical protein